MSPKTAAQNRDSLGLASENLSRALAAAIAGREREWAEAVAATLARMETALRRHRAVANDPDGLFAAVDEIRPALAKQADELRNTHSDFLDQVNVLRDEVESALAAMHLASDLDSKTVEAKVGDLNVIRQLGDKLLADLEQTKAAEMRLVSESVNTDIGGSN
jgi:predicted nucleic acid-binding protein